MPRRDGTGPLGQGSMTGRGAGDCGTGQNVGRGSMGLGRRLKSRRFGFNAVADTDKDMLLQEKRNLEARLDDINKQLR